MKSRSGLSAGVELDLGVNDVGLPPATPEYLFHSVRKWKLDRAWVPQKIAVEIEGGTWKAGGSRHSRGQGFEDDCEKYAEAICLGWTILRVTTNQIIRGEALTWLRRIFRARFDLPKE